MKLALADKIRTGIHRHGDADQRTAQKWTVPPIKSGLPNVDQSTLSHLMRANLGVGIVVSNSRGKITLVNAAAKRLARSAPEGKSLTVAPNIWGELFDVSERHVPVKQWPCIRALQGETTAALECRLVRPDGSACNILFGSCPIREPGPQIDGSFSTLTDVTEQKWREVSLCQEAVARERARLAAEIHDTLVQGLNATVLQLEVLHQELLENPQGARARLCRIRETARESLAEARRSMWVLSREPLAEEDPAVSLGFLARKLFGDTPIQLQLHLAKCGWRLGSEMRFDLARIGKEALTNVLKHSRATIVRIELTYSRKSARLCVLDNGCGFGGVHVGNAQGGFGLFGLKTRAERVGGKVMVQSRRGWGTRVVATVPLAA